MVKVAYFGKHISNKIREVNRIFSEILISPFIVRNKRKIRYETYDEFIDIKKRVIISFDTDKQGDFVTKDVLNYVNSNSIDDRTFEFMRIIYNKLNYNSNKVIIDFSDKDVKNVCVNKYIFDKCISKLQSTHCIRRTNIFKVYIVNHNIIFKGDYLDFIKTYNTIYRNAFTVTNVYGHVILDKSINYGK
jgi:hypothetical protein